ncbi:hypothetical protein D3C87_2141150 [compost metagenome]
MTARNRNDIAVKLVAPTGIIFKHFGDAYSLATNVTDGATCGATFNFGNQRGMFANTPGDFIHHTTAC